MGLEADGSPSVCTIHADCCDGWNLVLNKDINQTYAQTHWYCYPEGHPPDWTNGSNSTNLTGIIFDGQIDYGVDLSSLSRLQRQTAARIKEIEWKYGTFLFQLRLISGSISMATMIIVLAIYCAMLFYRPLITDRISSRLWITMIVVNVIHTSAGLYKPEKANWQCTTSAALIVWSKICSVTIILYVQVFFSSAIGFNLIRVVVYKMAITKITAGLYFFLPIMVSAAIIARPLSSGILGFNRGVCFFKFETGVLNLNYFAEGLPKNELDKLIDSVWLYFGAWIIVGSSLCLILILILYSKLHNQRKLKMKYEKRLLSGDPEAHGQENAPKFELTKKNEIIHKGAVRMGLFLFVPLLCSLPVAIYDIFSFELFCFSNFISNLEGFFNALIYLLDPSVALCYELYRGYLSEKYVLKYHYIDNTGQVSKEPKFSEKGFSIKWEKRAILGMRFSKPQKMSWPIVSYHIIKILFTKQTDFTVIKTRKMELDPTNAIKISAALEEAAHQLQAHDQSNKIPIQQTMAFRLERNEEFAEEMEILKTLDL